MADYSRMTQEDFDGILIDLMRPGRISAIEILAIPGVYALVAAHLRDEIRDIWSRRQDDPIYKIFGRKTEQGEG